MAEQLTAPLTQWRRTPAAAMAEQMSESSSSAVTLRELPFPVQIGLRAKVPSTSATALKGVLGFPLPTTHGGVTGDPTGLHVMWLSPDEFHAVDVSTEQQPGVAAPYAEALEGLPGHAVDLSANRAVLVLEGPRAREVLQKGCHVDLHPREFPINSAVATGLGPVAVYLHRAAENEWRIYPRASFAEFIAQWLLDAMLEFSSH